MLGLSADCGAVILNCNVVRSGRLPEKLCNCLSSACVSELRLSVPQQNQAQFPGPMTHYPTDPVCAVPPVPSLNHAAPPFLCTAALRFTAIVSPPASAQC